MQIVVVIAKLVLLPKHVSKTTKLRPSAQGSRSLFVWKQQWPVPNLHQLPADAFWFDP